MADTHTAGTPRNIIMHPAVKYGRRFGTSAFRSGRKRLSALGNDDQSSCLTVSPIFALNAKLSPDAQKDNDNLLAKRARVSLLQDKS